MKDLVIMNEQQVVTTSLTVTEVFGKRHDHVLRDIEDNITDLEKSGNPKEGERNVCRRHLCNMR